MYLQVSYCQPEYTLGVNVPYLSKYLIQIICPSQHSRQMSSLWLLEPTVFSGASPHGRFCTETRTPSTGSLPSPQSVSQSVHLFSSFLLLCWIPRGSQLLSRASLHLPRAAVRQFLCAFKASMTLDSSCSQSSCLWPLSLSEPHSPLSLCSLLDLLEPSLWWSWFCNPFPQTQRFQ